MPCFVLQYGLLGPLISTAKIISVCYLQTLPIQSTFDLSKMKLPCLS